MKQSIKNLFLAISAALVIITVCLTLVVGYSAFEIGKDNEFCDFTQNGTGFNFIIDGRKCDFKLTGLKEPLLFFCVIQFLTQGPLWIFYGMLRFLKRNEKPAEVVNTSYDYIKLIQRFLDREIDAQKFRHTYLHTFKNETTHISGELFEWLDGFFAEVNAYTNDSDLLEGYPGEYIDESQLRDVAEKTLKGIRSLA